MSVWKAMQLSAEHYRTSDEQAEIEDREVKRMSEYQDFLEYIKEHVKTYGEDDLPVADLFCLVRLVCEDKLILKEKSHA